MFKKLRLALTIIHTFKNWPTYFLQYFGLTSAEHFSYTLRNGITYKTRSRTPDFGTILEIWAHQVYTPPPVSIRATDIVVDIGAHIGIFSVFASRQAHQGKVYAFEPIPENFKLLEENIQTNTIKNILPFNLAVAAKNERRSLFIKRNAPTMGTLYVPTADSQEIIVPTISFKDFIVKNHISTIDFLKMDCEGAEYDILLSCSSKILARIKRISMEYHDLDETRTAATLQKFLESQGFMVHTNPAHHTLYAINKRNTAS